MKRFDPNAFLKSQRPQTVAFAIGHRGPIDGAHSRVFIEGKLVELHFAYLQPIRNNGKGRFIPRRWERFMRRPFGPARREGR